MTRSGQNCKMSIYFRNSSTLRPIFSNTAGLLMENSSPVILIYSWSWEWKRIVLLVLERNPISRGLLDFRLWSTSVYDRDVDTWQPSCVCWQCSAPTNTVIISDTSETFAHSRRRPMTVSHDVESLMSVSRWCAVALNGPGHHGPCRQRHVSEAHTHSKLTLPAVSINSLFIRRILLQLGNNRWHCICFITYSVLTKTENTHTTENL